MEWQGVEIEVEVPCVGGRKHPVRLRFTGWGEYEVVHTLRKSARRAIERIQARRRKKRRS